MSDILDCGRTSVLNGVLFLFIAGNIIKYILCLQDVPLIVGKVFIVKVFAVNMFNLKALMKRLFDEKAFGCKYVQLQVHSAANRFGRRRVTSLFPMVEDFVFGTPYDSAIFLIDFL
mgnify:CR=1 FL=1